MWKSGWLSCAASQLHVFHSTNALLSRTITLHIAVAAESSHLHMLHTSRAGRFARVACTLSITIDAIDTSFN
jgi:hypothetical protein